MLSVDMRSPVEVISLPAKTSRVELSGFKLLVDMGLPVELTSRASRVEMPGELVGLPGSCDSALVDEGFGILF